jgi:hypothetical protein
MLISHESPISMLSQSRTYNDYDYALVHLFDTHPEYYNFFKASLASNREVLLDNSIFELKHSFEPTKYSKYIEELKPTYFIVPDVLEDAYATIESYGQFVKSFNGLPGLKIGAVQGSTYQEIVECYKYMSEHADYIAISFDFSWYQQIGVSQSKLPHTAKLERMCTGRQKLIDMLMKDNYWNYKKPHHLLGCSLAREFSAYTSIKSIRSVDTSNPIVAAIHNLPYVTGIGLYSKPSTLLADLIDVNLDSDQIDLLHSNVKKFKQICNGN